MDLETLLLHPPSLHMNRSGDVVSWGAGGRLLRYMDQKLHEGDVTLETGAGLSTLVFAMKKCLHTAAVPDQPYVLHQSYASGSTSVLRRARWAVSTGTQFAGRATALARRGEWTELRRRAEATLRTKPE